MLLTGLTSHLAEDALVLTLQLSYPVVLLSEFPQIFALLLLKQLVLE